MKQLTAVEWLINQINSSEWQDKYIWHKEEIFKEAKQMEKEQIMDAANTLLYRGTGPGDMWAEQYYNDTFKN